MRIVLSGCSGGGKSTILSGLAARGYSTFAEPGRMVVETQLAAGGRGLPWEDHALFSELVIGIGIDQWKAAKPGINFYDRSLIDAVTWYERQPTPVPSAVSALVDQYPYDNPVFMTPPWPEIFVSDAARKHAFSEAVAEFDALRLSYPAKGYALRMIPQSPVAERVDWVLRQLDLA